MIVQKEVYSLVIGQVLLSSFGPHGCMVNNTSEFENKISHTLHKLNNIITKTLTRTINGDNLQMGSNDNDIYTNPDGLWICSNDASPYNHKKIYLTNLNKCFQILLKPTNGDNYPWR